MSDDGRPTSYEQLKRDANSVAAFGGRLIWYAFVFVLLACAAWLVQHVLAAIF